MQTIAQNLANENTSRVADGGAFRPMRLISGPAGAFVDLVTQGSRMPSPLGVKVVGIEPEKSGNRRMFDPTHPDSDAAGFVTFPNVDHASQMALLVKTARVYESNLTVLSLAQQMSMRALNMGKR